MIIIREVSGMRVHEREGRLMNLTEGANKIFAERIAELLDGAIL